MTTYYYVKNISKYFFIISRETIKIGIIYIKLGQETEQSIMENENGSDEYNQFVLSLGWEVMY